MNLIFLFSDSGIPILLPANKCEFDKKKRIYVSKDKNKKLADVSTGINPEFYCNMYGIKFEHYCIITINGKDFRGRACFLINREEEGTNKFVVFFLNGTSLCSLANDGIILTPNMLVACGVSRHDGISLSEGPKKVEPLYRYVQKKNLLKHIVYNLLVFVCPIGAPQLSYKRTVEDIQSYPSTSPTQKSVAMLFNHIFDTQLLAVLLPKMTPEESYKLDFFDEKGKLFYDREVKKDNASKTVLVTSAEIALFVKSEKQK